MSCLQTSTWNGATVHDHIRSTRDTQIGDRFFPSSRNDVWNLFFLSAPSMLVPPFFLSSQIARAYIDEWTLLACRYFRDLAIRVICIAGKKSRQTSRWLNCVCFAMAQSCQILIVENATGALRQIPTIEEIHSNLFRRNVSTRKIYMFT